MSWVWLGCGLLLGAAGESSTVYHYRDAQGVDHYVNHPEQVPSDASPDQLKLTEDLNPQLAKEMAESAHRAADEAKAQAAEEARLRADEESRFRADADNRKGSAPQPGLPARSLPPETRLLLIWSIAFTVVFMVLWSTRGVLLRRSPSLAVAFQPLRWGTGLAALLSWIFLAILARGWMADHFPPLQAISRAQANVDKINRQQKQAEQALDKALKAP